MGTPLFGHGYLHWDEKVPNKVYYAIPWDHFQQQANVDGQASLSLPNSTTSEVQYQIRYLGANNQTPIDLVMAAGKFAVKVTPLDPNRTMDYYFALVSGYVGVQARVKSLAADPDYDVVAIKVQPHTPPVPDGSKNAIYDWENEIPQTENNIKVTITSTEGVIERLSPDAAGQLTQWVAMSSDDRADVKRLGSFRVFGW